MTALRILLGTVGIVMVGVGVVFLSDDAPSDLVNVLVWLVAGVVVHDGIVAPLVIVVGVFVVLRLPGWVRAPAVAGAVLLMTVTLTAIPVLGRFGAKADDLGLLGRPYGVLWLVFAAVVTLAAAASALFRRRPGKVG